MKDVTIINVDNNCDYNNFKNKNIVSSPSKIFSFLRRLIYMKEPRPPQFEVCFLQKLNQVNVINLKCFSFHLVG